MEERAEGIILRTRPLTDTSLIVQWITPELGRIGTVAKGARKPKSPFAGKLDLLIEAEFSLQRSRRSELHALREVRVMNRWPALRSDLALLHQAAYFTVLIELGTERETPLAEVYALLLEYLRHLPAEDRIPESMFLFEFKFLSLLGYKPEVKSELFEQSFGNLEALPSESRRALNRGLKESIARSLERLPPQRQRAIDALRKPA